MLPKACFKLLLLRPPASSVLRTLTSPLSSVPTCSPLFLPLVLPHAPPWPSLRLTGLTPLTKAGPAHHCLPVAMGGGKGRRGWQWAQERREVAELAPGCPQTLGRGVKWGFGTICISATPHFYPQKSSCFCPRQSITQFMRGDVNLILPFTIYMYYTVNLRDQKNSYQPIPQIGKLRLGEVIGVSWVQE